MPRVIKPDQLVPSDNVFLIPDTLFIEDVDEEQPDYDYDGEMTDEEYEQESEEEAATREEEQLTRSECERMLAEAHAEAERIRAEAQQQGYRDAYNEASGRAEQCMQDVYEQLDDMQNRQHEYFVTYERELKHLALEIAQKVLMNTIREDDQAMHELVRSAVLSIKGADWITVELSDQLVALVDTLKQEFAQAGKTVDFVPQRGAEPDTCTVRSTHGVMDISVSEQIGNLKTIFDKLDEDQ